MIDCVSVDNMRRSDAYTIANLVSGLELIRRAAYGVYRSVEWKGAVAIVAGSGNNGADGFALACILKERGISADVFTVSERLHADCAAYAEMAAAVGVSIKPYQAECLCSYDIIVDCMLGTGFCGPLRDRYRTAIEEINASRAYVVSVDINSGMNGDGGEAEAAVRSDLTVTIGFVKKGLITDNAAKYIGHLVCVDIGIVLLETEDYICTPDEWDCLHTDGNRYRLCPAYLDMEIKRYKE